MDSNGKVAQGKGVARKKQRPTEKVPFGKEIALPFPNHFALKKLNHKEDVS
jgi:hypothetical protein